MQRSILDLLSQGARERALIGKLMKSYRSAKRRA